MHIRRIGIVGAGTMGAGIAALAASAGVPVVLLDIPAKDGDPNSPAKQGLEQRLRAGPAAFWDGGRASPMGGENGPTALPLRAERNLVIEQTTEKPGPKRELYPRLEDVLRADAII